MIIRIEKSGNSYRADIKELPGSPPIGIAETPEKAVADMFFTLLHPATEGRWNQYMDFKTLEIEMIDDPDVVEIQPQALCPDCGSEWDKDENPFCPNLDCPEKTRL